MKLEKAIRVLTELGDATSGDMEPEDVEALILGIEALKRIEDTRSGLYWRDLPGETEE